MFSSFFCFFTCSMYILDDRWCLDDVSIPTIKWLHSPGFSDNHCVMIMFFYLFVWSSCVMDDCILQLTLMSRHDGFLLLFVWWLLFFSGSFFPLTTVLKITTLSNSFIWCFLAHYLLFGRIPKIYRLWIRQRVLCNCVQMNNDSLKTVSKGR